MRQKVGNFPGVTVEHHTGYIRDADGEEVALIDLPGIYSLTPKSEDEKVAVDVLQGDMPGMARPDAVIVVLNSNNLHSHLVLAGARDRARPADAGAAQHGGRTAQAGRRRRRALAGAAIGNSGCAGQRDDRRRSGSGHQFPFRRRRPLPEPMELPVVGSTRSVREWAVRVGENANYRRPATPVWTRRLDNVFLHRIWGPVIFAVVVIAVFQTIFAVGQPLSNLLQKFLDVTGSRIGRPCCPKACSARW